MRKVISCSEEESKSVLSARTTTTTTTTVSRADIKTSEMEVEL
jgi:hypothetical protein